MNKEKEQCGELVDVDFPMNKRPVAVQLTIHINNLLNTYPEAGRKHVIAQFKDILVNESTVMHVHLKNLMAHYGKRSLRKWFKDIYGWEYKKTKRKAS